MPNVKLTYFDFPGGRGEDCRLALFIAGIDFEDDRVKGADWPVRKAGTPFGSLPVLEIQGKPPIAQSNAILGLIGRKHDLLPADEFEAARHIAILNTVEDIRTRATSTTKFKDDDEKKAFREKFAAGALKHWADNVEVQIAGPFFGGNDLSVADLKIFVFLNFVKSGQYDYVPADYYKAYPKLETLHAAVASHPKVAEWQARFK